MTPYQKKVMAAFNRACAANLSKGIRGASATEVTSEMRRAGTLASMDTVIDIAEQLEQICLPSKS